jgi:hypothetical protein
MNGRINLAESHNHLSLFDKMAPRSTTYHEALTGNWTETPLSRTFFSSQNQQILQNGIRAGVYKMSAGRYTIGTQSPDELKMVMRGIFLQQSMNQPGNVRAQCERLNQAVLNYVVPQVYGEAKGYLTYLRDVSTLVVPLAPPINTVSYDKTLELKPFF